MHQNCNPRFKVGDRVCLGSNAKCKGTITDGPFEPGLKRIKGDTRRSFTYVVVFDQHCSRKAVVFSEFSLKRITSSTYRHSHEDHPMHEHLEAERHL